MPSKILSIAGLLLLSVLFIFCNKDKESTGEGPFFEFFNDAGIVIDTVEQASDSWEYGFAFTPLKSGKITEFGVKLPATGTFTVTLWDLSDATPRPVRSHPVNIDALSENANNEIPQILLTKGKKYGITVRSNAFYRVTKSGNGTFSYPRTFGNLQIDAFHEGINNTNTAEFPTTTTDTRVAPCVNVIFIAD